MRRYKYIAASGIVLVPAFGCGEPTHNDGLSRVAPAASGTPPAQDDGSPAPGITYVPYKGGGPVTGRVGPDGGTLSRLLFAVVGDTRPALEDDTARYPTEVIGAIYAAIEAMREWRDGELHVRA